MKGEALVVTVLVLAMTIFAVMTVTDDSDAASGYTVNVYIEDGGSVKKLSGSGTGLTEILEDAVTSGGHTIDIGSVRVNSLDGVKAPDGKAWTVQQWLPPRGWQIVDFSKASANLVNGTSYFVYLSDVTADGYERTYSSPTFEPTATGYFFIKFVEDVEANSYITSTLTKEQRTNGFWISGTGSNMAWAFKNACEKYGLELDMSNGIKGNIVDPDYIGWLNSFFGLKDELMSGDTETGNWRYWSQFYWNGDRWVYSQTLGHYDPGVNPYFALIRQITTKDVVSTDLGTTPSDAPISKIRNGCTVKFVDGDGKTIKIQRVSYFGSATAPASATKTSTLDHSYVFKEWEGNYSQVISDTVVTATFDEVANIRVTGVGITDSETTIPSGASYQFTATVYPSDATNKDVKWSVTDSSVASIGGDGTLKALRAGNVTVMVTTVDGGFSDSVQVSVTADTGKVWSVEISGAPDSLEIGKAASLKAVIQPTTANDKTVSWSSSDESIATVDQNGKVTAVSAGEVEITVTTQDGGYTDMATIVVTPSSKSVWSVEIEGGDVGLRIGGTVKLVAEVRPATAVDKTVVWSVGDESIAEIDQNGCLIGKKVGTTTVVVRTNDGGKTAEIQVNVARGPDQAEYVIIIEGDQIVKEGSTIKLTEDVDPSATDKNVRWYSEDESVATVDAEGNVTAVSPGATRITVEVIDGGAEAFCLIRVYSDGDVSHISEDDVEVEDEAASVDVDAKRMKALADNGASYTMKTDGLGTVVLSPDILSKSSSEGSITLSVKIMAASDLGDIVGKVVGDCQAFEYRINDSDVPDLGGKATVSIPYALKDGEVAKDLKVYCVDYKGNTEEFACTYESGMAVFETSHFSIYFVSAEKIGGSDDGSGSSALWIGIVAAIIVAIGVAAFLRMRGRI